MESQPVVPFDIDRFFPDSSHDAGDAGRASFQEKRSLYLAASKRYLIHYREVIRQGHREGASGEAVVAQVTAMTDLLVQKLYRSICRDIWPGQPRPLDQIALVALGGYGRGELNPYSDIDLMFLHNGRDPQRVEDIANKVLYFLWDMRLDVGYSVRTPDDCVEMAQADSTVRTALLDARLVIGNRHLFRQFEKVLISQIVTKGSDSFIRNKVEERRKRLEKYGSSIYILEPNLKEGEGGLRDLHTALWIAKIRYKVTDPRELIVKGIISEEEYQAYHQALSYLWRIRNELHYRAGRKNDQLTFESQINLASFFGYEDRGKSLAVEQFMQDYYRHATRVEHLASSIITRCSFRDEGPMKFLGYFTRRPIGEGFYVLKGELIIPDESVIARDPARLMKLFEYAQKQGVKLNIKVKELVRKNLHLVNDRFRRSREVNQSFFNILNSRKGVPETLRLMHHLEFLIHYIPEFERTYCKVQHDLYHIYTLDIHSLFAVEELVRLWEGGHRDDLPLLTRLAGEVENRTVISLAVLFHDIGKGEGSRHAERGADMMPTISRRMGLSRQESEQLEFLVRRHLDMAHIAQRRDLNDEKMIIEFARRMGTTDNLKKLYLLTYADIRAVGPDVWTGWKGMLLQELYDKTFQVLERGNFRLEASGERTKTVKKKVAALLEDELPATAVRQELKAMTTRHLLSNPPEHLAAHVRLLHELGSQTPLIMKVVHEQLDQDKGYSNFTICTFDHPGLFARITGVMAANGMNILGAQLHTGSNGKVLDILKVNSPKGFIITDENRWQRLRHDMEQVLSGVVNVKSLVERQLQQPSFMEGVKPRFPTRVEIDNEISEEYTVIDIFTHDTVGLLYRIASTLTELGLYIDVSKISTKVDQAADVFYVRDIFRHKITDEARCAEIRARLLAAIDGESGTRDQGPVPP